MDRKEELSDNYKRVCENIEKASARRGTGKKVTLLGATKTVCAEDILYVTDVLGLGVIGENRVQELCEKYPALSGHADIQFIGTLQTNKVRDIIGKVSLIHSVGSLHLAQKISDCAKAADLTADVLCEINIGEEESKSGVMPDEAEEFCAQLMAMDGIRLRGIMTMAPASSTNDELRNYFRKTYGIFVDISQKKSHNIIEPILSMGMSSSYEIAIEEGANLVRVGSAIFGKRNYN